MILDGTVYYYILSLQGDVMGLVDGDGNLLVSYLYEAYGECFYITDTSDMVNTLIGANPLLYRSYLIDTGTGLYYLQSRYYDPTLGRFINADAFASTGQGLIGQNMYAYCLNNPVNLVDHSGENPIAIFYEILKYVVVIAIVIFVAVVITSPQFQKDFHKIATAIGNGISQFVDILVDVCVTGFQTLEEKARQKVEQSQAAVQVVPQYRSPTEVHHIVAKRARNASVARYVLDDVGISYDSPYNLVSSKTGLHRRLHTDFYYLRANQIIIDAYMSALGDPVQQQINVLAALGTLKATLLVWNEASPY